MSVNLKKIIFLLVLKNKGIKEITKVCRDLKKFMSNLNKQNKKVYNGISKPTVSKKLLICLKKEFH